jgi:hypothetical protein
MKDVEDSVREDETFVEEGVERRERGDAFQ